MLQIQGACRRDEIPAAHPPWAASTFDVEKTWRTDPTASLSCALTSSNGFKLILCQNIAAILVRLRNWLDAARGHFTCVIVSLKVSAQCSTDIPRYALAFDFR